MSDVPHLDRSASEADHLSILDTVWKVQRKYSGKFVEYESLTPEAREQYTRDHILYAIGELMTMTDHLHWKVHRKERVVATANNILEEAIDTFKYLVGICIAWDITPKQFIDAFFEKSNVVEQRWKQEFEHPYDPAKHKGLVVVDIDGVLADYAGGYLKWIESKAGVKMAQPWPGCDLYDVVAKAVGADRADKLKHEYRETGGKLSLPKIAKADEMTHTLRYHGLYVVLLSARPYKQYKRIMADTLNWLRDHRIEYDAICWDAAKYSRIMRDYPDAVCVFEDEAGHAAPIADKGIPVMMPVHSYNEGFQHAGITFYNPRSWEQLLPKILKLMEERRGQTIQR